MIHTPQSEEIPTIVEPPAVDKHKQMVGKAVIESNHTPSYAVSMARLAAVARKPDRVNP